eukprot:scaffold2077_cov119-Cylindrotheca_fusiformis.AAC.9
MANEEGRPPLAALILDLASSRADCIPVRKRNAMIADVTRSLQEESSSRSVLANLGCKYAYSLRQP